VKEGKEPLKEKVEGKKFEAVLVVKKAVVELSVLLLGE
jgi:hypothetical protein